jgi:hypothetical protein
MVINRLKQFIIRDFSFSIKKLSLPLYFGKEGVFILRESQAILINLDGISKSKTQLLYAMLNAFIFSVLRYIFLRIFNLSFGRLNCLQKSKKYMFPLLLLQLLQQTTKLVE